MAQKQCPNCGGYKTEKLQTTAEFLNSWTAAILVILFMWTIIVPVLYFAAFYAESKKPPQTPRYRCNLCGYIWEQKPGEKLDVTVRPDLIAKGEQKLREEEEKRKELARHAAAHHWRQQQQKKK